MKLGWMFRGAKVAALSLLFAVQTAGMAKACDVDGMATAAKAISILRQVENGLNYLALVQTNALVERATGIPTLRIRDNDIAFYGPLMGLQKATDKNQAFFWILKSEWLGST